MIRLYGFWRSAASFRVRIALNLKRLQYEEIMIDLDAGTQHTAEYKKINPQSAVPTIIFDNGLQLVQSIAILEYLEETYPDPPLLPATPADRARVRSLALLWAADHHPLIVPRVRTYLTDIAHQDEAMRTAWIKHWFREGLAIGETRLATDPQTGRFCHHDTPTIADLCLISQVLGARGFGVPDAAFPTISRITGSCLSLQAFSDAAPLRQPGAPATH